MELDEDADAEDDAKWEEDGRKKTGILCRSILG